MEWRAHPPRAGLRVWRHLVWGPRLVVIGGGTGMSTLLRGLRDYSRRITAVVTVTDDGGSSGRLREERHILPPGDLRACLIALASTDESVIQLFEHRFAPEGQDSLSGHSLGNVILAGLCEKQGGDLLQAVRAASQALKIRGCVLPSTLQEVHLQAEMEDGSVIQGETAIVRSPLRIRRVSLAPAGARAPEEVLTAIRMADAIVLGPGSLYTSVIPNLLVAGIAEAVATTRAPCFYVCNVRTQPGETDGYSAVEHVSAIERHVARSICQLIVVNTVRPAPPYAVPEDGATWVEPDLERLRALGYRPMAGDFLNRAAPSRHDAAKVATAILAITMNGGRLRPPYGSEP